MAQLESDAHSAIIQHVLLKFVVSGGKIGTAQARFQLPTIQISVFSFISIHSFLNAVIF